MLKARTLALACSVAATALCGCQTLSMPAARGAVSPQTKKPASAAGNAWPSLFSWHPWSTFNGQNVTQGDVGCVVKGGTVNPNWTSWTTQTSNSLSVSNTLNECHTVNTSETCVFNVGDDGVTGFSFSYNLTGPCMNASNEVTTWLAFWIYTQMVPGLWQPTAEVDAIESWFGPSRGLNMNFAGNPNQAAIPLPAISNGKISVTFSGTGDNVLTTVTETTSNTSAVKANPLSQNQGYFFVLDTANYPNDGGVAGCSVTISDLQMTGTVPPGQCVGIPGPPSAS